MGENLSSRDNSWSEKFSFRAEKFSSKRCQSFHMRFSFKNNARGDEKRGGVKSQIPAVVNSLLQLHSSFNRASPKHDFILLFSSSTILFSFATCVYLSRRHQTTQHGSRCKLKITDCFESDLQFSFAKQIDFSIFTFEKPLFAQFKVIANESSRNNSRPKFFTRYRKHSEWLQSCFLSTDDEKKNSTTQLWGEREKKNRYLCSSDSAFSAEQAQNEQI